MIRRYLPIALILLAYLLVGALYAIYTPDWQAPDEPAHYNYIRQLADGRFPIIQTGDYNQSYQEQVIGSQFDEQYSVASFEYEDYQPPLYYMLQTPVYWLFDGALRPLRFLSVLFGAGVVLLAYLIARQLFPGKDWLWLTTAAFVAFVPQHVAMLAAVNNDSLAELLIAAILFCLVSRPDTLRQRLVLGVLLGLGFLTKATVYLMVPVIGLYLLWANWRQWRSFFKQSIQLFGLAGLIGLPWWLRNMFVYGGVDILGIGAHNRIVTGQPRTAEWIANFGLADTVRRLVQTTFQSFWGQFGWMGVVMRPWVYQPLLLFTVLTIVGLMLYGFGRSNPALESGEEKPGNQPKVVRPNWPVSIDWLVLASAFGLSLLLFLTYNLTFVQHQGRYLFPGLIPIALAVSLAWVTLIQPLSRRWETAVYLVPIGLALALFGLDLLALFRFIVPAFNG